MAEVIRPTPAPQEEWAQLGLGSDNDKRYHPTAFVPPEFVPPDLETDRSDFRGLFPLNNVVFP